MPPVIREWHIHGEQLPTFRIRSIYLCQDALLEFNARFLLLLISNSQSLFDSCIPKIIYDRAKIQSSFNLRLLKALRMAKTTTTTIAARKDSSADCNYATKHEMRIASHEMIYRHRYSKFLIIAIMLLGRAVHKSVFERVNEKEKEGEMESHWNCQLYNLIKMISRKLKSNRNRNNIENWVRCFRFFLLSLVESFAIVVVARARIVLFAHLFMIMRNFNCFLRAFHLHVNSMTKHRTSSIIMSASKSKQIDGRNAFYHCGDRLSCPTVDEFPRLSVRRMAGASLIHTDVSLLS